MKIRTKQLLLVFCGLIALCIGSMAWRSRAAAIDSTLAWARLAPFPGSASELTVATEGGPFSRAIRCSFTAPAAHIESWLQQSPGTREVVPETRSSGVRHFQINPGGGAQHAEVTVDDARHSVSIYVYWS